MVGVILSILILLIGFVYASLKFNIMRNYDDTNIMFKEIEHYYTHDDALSAKMGFNLVFGLADFSGNQEFLEDPDYATVEIEYRSWGWNHSVVGS